MTNEQRTQILLKHLLLQYGEEEGLELFTTYSTRLFSKNGLAWALGKESLTFFCEYFLNDTYYADRCKPLAPIHYQMWRDCTDIIKNKTVERQAYLLPRGTAKSTITMGVALWSVLYNYKSFVLICSAVADTASKFIQNIKAAISDNKEIKEAFGEVHTTRNICNAEQIEFANSTLIQSISAASSMRGKQYKNKRIELAILDDYQKDDEVQTEEQREKKWKRFSDDVSFAMQADNSTILALGTLQRVGDFYDRVRNSPSFITVQKKCIPLENIEELFNTGLWKEFKEIYTDIKNPYRLADCTSFYYEHEKEMHFPMLWDEGWDRVKIAMRYYDNPASFYQEMQGEVEKVGVKKIHSLSALPTLDIEKKRFIRSVLSVDPAGTSTKKSDYYAYCVLSQAEDNELYYARKTIIAHHEYEEYLQQIINLLIDFPEVETISIEKNTYMGADVKALQALITKHQFLNNNYTFINRSRTKNKDARINTIIPAINRGSLIFNSDDEEAVKQIKEFAGCEFTAHDDAIDCVADAMEQIVGIARPRGKVFNFK